KVQPNTIYRLSAWIKTKGIKNVRSGVGALLNVHNINEKKTNAVTGDSDWTKVEVTFNSANQTTLSINCLYGGWGQSIGTAWYDDIELVAVSPVVSLPGAIGRVTSIVATHYAQRGPTESIIPLLASLNGADPALATVIIDALATGWPAGKAPDIKDADKTT